MTETSTGKPASWKTFTKVPNLEQYRPTGGYYGRVKVNGKVVRRSLKTKVFTTAKLKLADFIKEQSERRGIGDDVPDTFKAARLQWWAGIELKPFRPKTRSYYRDCMNKLLETWPGLDKKRIARITESDCQKWAQACRKVTAPSYFNRTRDCLVQILDRALLSRNPAKAVDRLGIKHEDVEMTVAEFDEFASSIRHARGKNSIGASQLVRFLAYSGCRQSEAVAVRWKDIKADYIIVQNAKLRGSDNRSATRKVPIIPPMRDLLDKLGPQGADERVVPVASCYGAMKTASEKMGIEKRVSHHTMRKLFVTFCLDSGVAVHTVARWVNHTDPGFTLRRYAGQDSEAEKAAAKLVTLK